MDLSVYIKNLLYRYDCVIVPDFGGFITHLQSSQIKENIIEPPCKSVRFNSVLKQNDGLLVHHIARELQWEYQNALEHVQKEVFSWQMQLKKQSLFLEDIGMFWLNEEKKLIFKPSQKVNYHMDSYGLTPCKAEKISNVFKNFAPEKRHVFHFKNPLKYAAAGFILLATAIFLHRYGIIKTDATQNTQSASFLNIKKVKNTNNPTKKILAKKILTKKYSKKYYIVLGAFRMQKNILRLKNHIAKKGFQPKILPSDKKEISLVVIGGLPSKKAAQQLLKKAKKELKKDAWIFLQKK